MEDSKCRYGACVCQRYKAQNGKDECLYCEHRIGFHEIPFSNINIVEHPYGQCQKCRFCQSYKEGTPDMCDYCHHGQGFHRSWLSTSTITSSSFIPSISPKSNVGRPVSDSITIKHLVLLDKESSNKLPKKGTDLWNILMNRGHIKENVTISRADDILNKLRNLFGINDQRVKLKLYRPREGRPVEINDEELSFDSVKSNMTKANRRLYIGLDTDSSRSQNSDTEDSTLFQNNFIYPVDWTSGNENLLLFSYY